MATNGMLCWPEAVVAAAATEAKAAKKAAKQKRKQLRKKTKTTTVTEPIEASFFEMETRGNLPRSMRDKETRKAKTVKRKESQSQGDRAASAACFVREMDEAFERDQVELMKPRALEVWAAETSSRLMAPIDKKAAEYKSNFCCDAFRAMWETRRYGISVEHDHMYPSARKVYCTDDFIVGLDDSYVYNGLGYDKFIQNVVVPQRKQAAIL